MTQPEPIAVVGVSAIMPDAPTAQDFWANIRGGRYSITDVPAERWDPELYYDADPTAPDKTYSHDRRLGPRVPVGPDGVEAARPADRGRADGRGPAVGGERRALGPARRRLARLGRRPRPCRRHPRQRDRRREALRTTLRIDFPEFDRELTLSPSFAALPAEVQAAIRQRDPRAVPRPACPRSPRTRCPASWPTSSPAGSPTCSTSAGPTSPPTPRARRRWPRMSAAVAGLQDHHYRRRRHRRHRPQHGSRRRS